MAGRPVNNNNAARPRGRANRSRNTNYVMQIGLIFSIISLLVTEGIYVYMMSGQFKYMRSYDAVIVIGIVLFVIHAISSFISIWYSSTSFPSKAVKVLAKKGNSGVGLSIFTNCLIMLAIFAFFSLFFKGNRIIVFVCALCNIITMIIMQVNWKKNQQRGGRH